jgi:hypothetical protein
LNNTTADPTVASLITEAKYAELREMCNKQEQEYQLLRSETQERDTYVVLLILIIFINALYSIHLNKIESLRAEVTKLTASNTKLQSEIAYSSERFKVLVRNSDLYKDQIKALEERVTVYKTREKAIEEQVSDTQLLCYYDDLYLII